MSGEVPDGWSSATLGDVIRLEYGRALSASARAPGPIPVYGSNGVCGQHSVALVNKRGIVVGRKGTAGSVTVTTGPFWPIDTTYFVVPRVAADFDWLAATLEHARLSELNEATGVPGLNRDKAYVQPILVPPLEEQRRIAEVLRSVHDVLQAADRARHAANSVFRASLGEMLDGDAADWPKTRLGQVAEFINGRGFKPHEWESTGLPIIRIQNLNGGTEFNFYSGAYNPKIRVGTGELLFAWSGSRGTSFGPHIWKGPEGLLNYHTWKVVPTSKSDAQFLYFSLLRLTKQIEEEAHGASALVHTQKANIVDYETGWPSREVRMEVASTLSEMENARSAANVTFEQARALRQHIASDLLSGRVRVPA
ncbi:restriction endonuclease subunit S [Brevundimonas sp. SGAir0440]|uniref:restriction endonuclease subunit S n=1 Tax=Brevundimonas sp. SGAir0440 TaxID=2579977 RepID=UPI0010CCB638|nr:restriction endonuclease subunit S [Brevundimonas sp. SGAir0440]QCQ97760.1 restriction endonuclease subunit S [Brevundimonas sp. SGAir0440]